MDLALVLLAAAAPFITLAWGVNNEDKRYHERKMKQLEIERLQQEALSSTRKTALDRNAELLAKLEVAEKAVNEAYQRGYATGQEEIEKELAELRSSMKFRTSLIGRTEAERDALSAKITEMEQQEPAGTLHDDGYFVWRKTAPHQSNYAGWKTVLYALPGAQGLASSQDEWKTLAKDLLREIERQTCAHEETHRGGFLWEICDACGAKWADDEGGKPEFKWPKVVEKARAMLEADPGAKGETK